MEMIDKKAYYEVIEILNFLEKDITDKIPEKVISYFEKNKIQEHCFKFDETKTIDQQNILPLTEGLLTILYREYICNENEKKELDEILIKNEYEYEKQQYKTYDYDKLFKNKKDTSKAIEETVTEEVALVEYNKSLFKKIWNKIISILKK